MRRLTKLVAALLPLFALVVLTTPSSATTAACDALKAPRVAGAKVLSLAAVERHDYTVPPGPFNPDPIPGMPPFCDVTLKLTHPGAHDVVTVALWLPLTWNGRFQGTGGGGFAAGLFGPALAPALTAGYAAASTDAGVPNDGANPGTWATNPELVKNFASRSLHDMAVAGKALTTTFYGRQPNHTYWNGCSTGGRQGLMSAQRYPTDYDGILAASPAINWTRFLPAEQWPQVVMNELHTYPSQCKLEAFNTAAISACDTLDKVADNIISTPSSCHYNPNALIGKKIQCEGQEVTITKADAAVVAKIWQGPGVWSGLPKGTPFWALASTTEDGQAGFPFPLADDWIKHFLKKDPTFDTSTITYQDWYRLYTQSQQEYGQILDTSNPNLSAFHTSGGKLITWHGEADELIFPEGTKNYYDRVTQTTPGRTKDFYRLFMAPGAGHCGGGTGPSPTDPLAALVAWVEQGKPPTTLPATSPTATRELCLYPLVSRYKGGDPNQASSYRCARSY
jgi:Tannase and feruloyl esterase